mmetsp:Transcript_32520/g.71098  ORF Transcript_32520/g.71098 Transcript_32520/m.71098 type:complete len:311 (+) Transcript_32520:78-1010(+)
MNFISFLSMVTLLLRIVSLECVLQTTRGRRARARAAASSGDVSQSVKPLLYLHIPKTGSGFLRSLLHLPGLCPSIEQVDIVGYSPALLEQWARNQSICPHAFAFGARKFFWQHDGLGSDYADLLGHGMIMMRQPEQRILSDYHNGGFLHGEHAVSRPGNSLKGLLPPMALPDFLRRTSGCAVKMLTRGGEALEGTSPCTMPQPPSAAEVSLAKQRLREGFVFVGLTEEWNLSVCLLHTMFGGSCQAFEFNKEHSNPTGMMRNDTELGSFRDHDGPVYEEAREIFHTNLRKYGVTSESCKSCWSAAGLVLE